MGKKRKEQKEQEKKVEEVVTVPQELIEESPQKEKPKYNNLLC